MENSIHVSSGELGYVDPTTLCIFRQIRDGDEEVYSGIPELADDIAVNDMHNPLTVCVWDQEKTDGYSKLVKAVFNGDGKSRVENLVTYPDGKFRVMVAGHRRESALNLLRTVGCRLFEEIYPGMPPEECFKRRFNGGRSNPQPGHVKATFYHDITPEQGLALQLSENLNRKQISNPTQAKAIKGLYDLQNHLLPEDERLSASQFAERNQISITAVRDALRFCELPKSIRVAVEKGSFKWSCALELTTIHRLLRERPDQNGNMRTPKEIEYTLLSLSASEAAAKNLQSFRKYLRTWVEEVLGQLVMFEDLTLNPQQIATELLANEMVRGGAEFTIFLQRVSYALQNGWIKDGKLVPLHRHEARKAIAAILAEQRAMLPMLQLILDRDTAEESQFLCAKSQETLDDIMALAEKT